MESDFLLCTRGSTLIAYTKSLFSDGRRDIDRDVIKGQGLVIVLDEARGDFTFIQSAKL